MLTSPTTHKQIRAEAFKLLDELEDKLLTLESNVAQAHKGAVREAQAVLLEAQALLRLTAKNGRLR